MEALCDLNFELFTFDVCSLFLTVSFGAVQVFFLSAAFPGKILHFCVNRFVFGLIYLVRSLAHGHVQLLPPLHPQRDSDQSARPRLCVM